MTDTPPVACEVRDGGVAIVMIQRPEKLNALNLAVKRLVEDHVRRLSADAAISVIVLTGETRCSSPGPTSPRCKA